MPRLPARLVTLLLAAAASGLGNPSVPAAHANPRNGSVAAGSATITTTPRRVDINQTSERVIVNWQGFSIGADELTRFNQPSSGAVALNRVTGGEPSQILGQLSANGKILLINPNGILFGAGSRVDVAGLIATTANLRDDDFMAKRLNFSVPSGAPTASVVNRGTITVSEGGLVALVAPAVANEGVINARLGKVSLVAADRFTVDFHGDRLIQFALDDKVTRTVTAPDGAPLGAAVTNSGRIAADGGIVQMSANVARGVLDKVIDMSGVVEARAAREVGGAVVLDGGDAGTVQVSGRIDASGRGAGQSGGTVRILGERVGLFGGARVDATGDAGGGTVLVGGNYQGQGAERRAQATYVDKDATIAADAVTRGDGGTVIVWADKYTRFDGAISARGGAAGGNGGFVETSGKDILAATGRVDAAAPAGKSGQWLLDPTDITISGAATTNGTFNGANPNVFTPSAGAATGTVDVTTINNSLDAGTDVTITTNSTGGNAGNIVVQSAISKTAGGNAHLTLNAEGSYTQNAAISSNTGALQVTVNAGGNYVSNADLTTNGGNLTVNTLNGGGFSNNGMITTGAGSITLSIAGHFSGNNNITTTNASVNITAGTYAATGTINSNGAAVQINSSGTVSLGTMLLTTAPLTVTAAGAITQTGPVQQNIGGPASSFTAGANPITLTNGGNTLSNITLSNSGNNDVTVRNNGALVITGATLGSGALSLTSNSSSITQAGVITQAAGAGAVTLSAVTFIDLTNAGNQFRGAVGMSNVTAGATMQLRNAGALELGASSIANTNTVTITAGGAITQSGAFQTAAGTTTTVNAGANPITLTNTGNTFRSVALNNSGSNDVSVTNSVALTVNGSTVGRNLTLTADSLATPGTVTTAGGTLTVQPLTASTNVRLGGATALPGLNFTDAQIAQYSGFTGYVAGSATGTGTTSLFVPKTFANTNLTLRAGGSGGTVSMSGNALTMTGTGTVTLSAGGAVNTAAITTASGAVAITAGGTATINAPILTAGGAITIDGAIALPGSTTLNTAQSGSTGAAIALNGAIGGAGQSLTLNAGSAGDVSLQSAGSGGALGAITVQNARNVTGTGAISAASFTQSAGTGTTNFGGAGLTTSGAATITTASVAGAYAVGSFAVTSGQTIATGSIAGVSGVAAAALATAPGSSGTQTFNGCTIATTCSSTPAPTPSSTTTASSIDGALAAAQAAATRASRQLVGALGQGGPSEDTERSNVQGFEVAIPTQNVDWSDPGADLHLELAAEYQDLHRYLHGGEVTGRSTLGSRSGR